MAPRSRRAADFVPAGNVSYERKPEDFKGLLGDAFEERPLLARLNWLHVPLLTVTPALALFGVFTADFVWQTYAFAVFYYFFSGFGITAGAFCGCAASRQAACAVGTSRSCTLTRVRA